MARLNITRVAMSSSIIFIIITCSLPLIGSRAVNNVLTFDPDSPSGHSPGPPTQEPKIVVGSGGNGNITTSSACNLVPLTFGDHGSSGAQLLSYDDKFLIHVSHPVFQVSQGIVPTVVYRVTVEIPSGHEFSLEYWVNGLAEERSRLKRRHQRDRREVIELFPAPGTTVDQVLFCSKNSVGGLNQDSTMKLFTFHWFLTAHPSTISSSSSNSKSVNSGPPSFPTTLIFRLRLRSIVETSSSSVFEQNLSISVRPDCHLRVNVEERMKLTLNSLWNPQLENTGLNCTVLIRPRIDFGFELRLTNLSVYGIRNLCRGRFLSLTLPDPSHQQGQSVQSLHNVKTSTGKFIDHKSDEFSHEVTPTVIDMKFCGKIEDYSLDERTLTFSSKFTSMSTASNPAAPSPRRSSKNNEDDPNDSDLNPDPNLSTVDMSSSSSTSDYNHGLLLRISLPTGVKPKETFAIELYPLSPCQKVHLTDMSGQLKYSKTYDSDECSIVIHIPYGNIILAQLTFENSNFLSVLVPSPSVNGSGNESESELDFRDDDDANNGNITESNNVEPNMMGQDECKVTSNSNPWNYPDNSETNKVNSNDNEHNLLIQAIDLVSQKRFTWCFDGYGKSVYRRAWKSSGNRVKINFKLKYFDRFHLSYQSLQMQEITGNCEFGWVTFDYGCVILVENPATWLQAEEDCQRRSGHLITVRDELAEQKIQKIITESALFHPSRAYWIGANDRESEGNFQWTSGLPFIYTNWFPGWIHKGNEIINAQPNDDGFSGQDCVELRQRFSSHSSSQQDRNVEMNSVNVKASMGSESKAEKFHWNDRNCETKNFYLCEKTTYQKVDFACNQTIRLIPGQSASLVTSPAYPSSYPDNVMCVTSVDITPGYMVVVQFDEFILEESASCKYDSLEMYETMENGEILGRSNTTVTNINMEKGGLSQLNIPLEKDKDKVLQRICGNWNKRLKLLRYSTSPTATQLHFKFESDFSHHFAGFKAKIWTEMAKGWLNNKKEKEEQCVDQHMQKFGSYCYLFVSFPAVNWNTAHQTCSSIKANLVSILSVEEWNFLTQNLMVANHYDKKSIYWLGGFIDRSSQLVWMDRMPFNFSAFHPSDLQTISNWKCLSLYWHDSGKGDFAWRLSECNQRFGYICKKNTQVEVRHGFNRTFSGTGGKLSSPNFPANYYNHLDYSNHLLAPNGTQIVVRFSHLDFEPQEDCLYDYVELIDRKTRNATRYCGSHQDNLDKMDYVSSSNEVDVVVHTDFADTFTGFEIFWRAIDVSGCISGKTILTPIGNGLIPLQDATIFTPNFPHFNLPGLTCDIVIVAPAGQRIWLSFQIFEIGSRTRTQEDGGGESEGGVSSSSSSSASSATATASASASTSSASMDDYCLQQDHVVIDLGNNEDVATSEPRKSNNEVILCGNLTLATYRTSFMSYRERMSIRVVSPIGKTGRGFLGTFKAIPMILSEILPVVTQPNSSISLTSLNFPLIPPDTVNYTIALTAPPNYILTVRVRGKFYPKCHLSVGSYLEIRDPYVGNRSAYYVCQPDETSLSNVFHIPETNDNDNKIVTQNLPGMESTFTFRSSFNRFDIKQVYAHGYKGKKWNAEIITSLDAEFLAKIRKYDDNLLVVKECIPNPCVNGGRCERTDSGDHICRCSPPFTGPFCGLSLCDLNPCRFGDCFLQDKTYRCECHMGYGGEKCDRRRRPCDEKDKPCTGHGECIETVNSTYKCICHAYWEGLRCEARMSQIPYKPLSHRMLKEPFWLGMITVTVVLGVIGLVWCLKRHFPEKLDKLLNDDLDRNRGISWVSGRSPSSLRIGGGGGIGIRDAIPGTSQQSASPPTSRTFLGRFGKRKPSLLSLSSATSAVSVTASSPHQYENRTFSLDDLLRPNRSMMRTPSPHRRRNYSIQVRRDPNEKQQILQQLVSSGGSQSLDGEAKPSTPKPTLAEIIQMSEKRLRLASASSVTSDTGDRKQSSLEGEVETSFSSIPTPTPAATPSMMLTPTQKAEKKVTFARLLDKLAATEMTSSSSCSDVSCAEDKTIVINPKPPDCKKGRKGRFRRSKSYQRGRSSETDQEGVEMSSSDTTPDPICPPRFPTRLCISPTGMSSPSSSIPSTSAQSNKLQTSKSLTKMASADSLLALFRRFSSSSAPPSPQYSENEESSAGATPLSTPSSPRNSTLSIRPPAFLITTAEQANNNTIELPVIDPFNQPPGWRVGQTSSITLEVPMRDYCLSPIHEVPTPLPTPSHSPAHTPMLHRPRDHRRESADYVPQIRVLISSEDEGPGLYRSNQREEYDSPPRIINIPIPIISVSGEGEDEDENDDDDDDDGEEEDDDSTTPLAEDRNVEDCLKGKRVTGDAEMIPDVVIQVPPEVCLESKPPPTADMMEPQQGTAFVFPSPLTPVRPPRLKREKNKPPPLVFVNEILSCTDSKEDDSPPKKPNTQTSTSLDTVTTPDVNTNINTKNEVAVPVVINIEYATPPGDPNLEPKPIILNPVVTYPIICCQANVKSWDSNNINNIMYPLAPPVITINQSSEAESDSDTPVVRKLIRRPNLTFLSPFVGSSDRVPSESNLSTSGYSSMASPGPSRCPSVSPLCPDTEDYCSHHHGGQGPYIRRSSLTPATPRKSSLTQRRCSLNATSPLVSHISRDCTMAFSEKCEYEIFEGSDLKTHQSIMNQGFETDSAVEVEAETDLDNQPLTPGICDTISEETKMDFHIDLLQVPRKSMTKSRSLDMNVAANSYERKHQLKGDSLDSKLNSVDTSATTFTKLMIEKVCSSGSILEMPEEQLCEKKRLSPVSSRSDSPISELSVFGLGVTSPLTDSDGIYDCPSSEVPNGSKPMYQQQIRKSGRKRDRRTSTLTGHKKNDTAGCLAVDFTSTGGGSGNSSGSKSDRTMGSLNLDISSTTGTRESSRNLVPSSTSPQGGLRAKSPKRRIRASSFIPSTSSSSSESLNSPRSCGSTSSLTRTLTRDDSSCKDCLSTDRDRPLDSETLLSAKSSITESISLSCENLSKSFSPKDSDGGKSETTCGTSTSATIISGVSSKTPASRKLSRLRTITNQIRFLRRLELSLIRKRETLGVVSRNIERRDSLLGFSDSDSRCDTSDAQSSQSESFISLADNEKPLISLSATRMTAARRRKRKTRILASGLTHANTTSSDLEAAHKGRLLQYK